MATSTIRCLPTCILPSGPSTLRRLRRPHSRSAFLETSPSPGWTGYDDAEGAQPENPNPVPEPPRRAVRERGVTPRARAILPRRTTANCRWPFDLSMPVDVFLTCPAGKIHTMCQNSNKPANHAVKTSCIMLCSSCNQRRSLDAMR